MRPIGWVSADSWEPPDSSPARRPTDLQGLRWYHRPVPRARIDREPTPLDEPQPTAPPADAPPPPEPSVDAAGSTPPHDDPPGLREQIGSTTDSAKRLVGAHIELAKAEFGEIADQIKQAAIFGGIAIAAAIAAALLLSVGLPLFLGEWIFGSIGWGLLHGLLFLTALGVTGVALAVGVEAVRVGRAFGFGALLGIVVGVVLGLSLSNRAWGAAGDALLPLTEAGVRPLVTAVVLAPIALGIVVGLLNLAQALRNEEARVAIRPPSVAERIFVGLPTALFVGWLASFVDSYAAGVVWLDGRQVLVGLGGLVATEVVSVVIGRWRIGFALLTGVAIGVVLGLTLGAFSAIAFGGRVGAAVGVSVWLVAWSAAVGVEMMAFFRGFETESLKVRFYPQKTIDMTKETIEWARARMPLSRRS